MNANTLNDVFYSSNNKEELIHSLAELTTDINSPLSKIFVTSLNKTSALLPFFICINEYLFTLNSKTVSQSFYNTLKDYITLDILDIYFDYQLIDTDKDNNFFINLAEGRNNFNENSIVPASFSTVQENSESGQLDLFGYVICPFNLVADGVAKHLEDNGLDEETKISEIERKNALLNELIDINISVDEKQSENSENAFDLSKSIIDISDVESIDEVSELENIEDLESYVDFIPFETDEDKHEINFDEEDYLALDDYVYDFEDEELDNSVDLGVDDNTVLREQRAQQKAVEFIILSEWNSKYLGLVSDIFYRYGWSATKTALERLLAFDLTDKELELLFEIKIFWEENDHYWIAFERDGSSYSYSQHVMSWNSALKILRAFDSYPCIEEIADVIDRLYEVWMSKRVLQRRYWRFIGFVWLWAFEIKGSLPINDRYVFENNDFTPEAWEDKTDLFEVQLICDKECLGLPAPQVGDPYWYWTERRIQLSNQELNAETTKE